MPITPLSSPDYLPGPASRVDGPAEFAVAVTLEAGQALVAVRGEVDVRTAPTLGALLGVLTDTNLHEVVIDLAEVDFMGAAGLGVLAAGGAGLRASGRTLTLRAVPDRTRRLLRLTGVENGLIIQGAANAVDTDAVDTMADDLIRLATDHARDESLRAELSNVTALASAVLVGADGVSVSVDRVGRLTTLAASDATVLRMDGHQYDTGEGPCITAADQSHEIHVESLAEETRWPTFVPRAIEEGIASILSVPVMDGSHAVGALNIYSNTSRAFGTRERDTAALFAAQAARILGGATPHPADEELGGRLAEAIKSRTTVARAEGVLMARHDLTPDEAGEAIYRAARETARSVLEEAVAVLESTRADQ